jgi:hypothetical protein
VGRATWLPPILSWGAPLPSAVPLAWADINEAYGRHNSDLVGQLWSWVASPLLLALALLWVWPSSETDNTLCWNYLAFAKSAALHRTFADKASPQIHLTQEGQAAQSCQAHTSTEPRDPLFTLSPVWRQPVSQTQLDESLHRAALTPRRQSLPSTGPATGETGILLVPLPSHTRWGMQRPTFWLMLLST